MVLLAVADANYCFPVVDIGAYRRNSDGGILASSAFGKTLQNETLDLLKDKHLSGAANLGTLPYVFVGDEAFPLR